MKKYKHQVLGLFIIVLASFLVGTAGMCGYEYKSDYIKCFGQLELKNQTGVTVKISLLTFDPAYPSEEADCVDKLQIFPLEIKPFKTHKSDRCQGDYIISIESKMADTGFTKQEKTFSIECNKTTTITINYQ